MTKSIRGSAWIFFLATSYALNASSTPYSTLNGNSYDVAQISGGIISNIIEFNQENRDKNLFESFDIPELPSNSQLSLPDEIQTDFEAPELQNNWTDNEQMIDFQQSNQSRQTTDQNRSYLVSSPENRLVPSKRSFPDYELDSADPRVYRKHYTPRNRHLPSVVYKQEYVEMLFNSAASGNTDVMRAMVGYFNSTEVKDPNGNTPLLYATMAGNRLSVWALIGMDASVNAVNNAGITPLYVASYLSRKDLTELLLTYGAKVNVGDPSGKTPLFLAAERDARSLVDLLLRFGADINARMDNGDSPLHLAVKNNSVTAIKPLISAGAELDSLNFKGYTPLMLTAFTGNDKVASMLVNAGAALNLEDGRGRTATDIAKERQAYNVSKTLESEHIRRSLIVNEAMQARMAEKQDLVAKMNAKAKEVARKKKVKAESKMTFPDVIPLPVAKPEIPTKKTTKDTLTPTSGMPAPRKAPKKSSDPLESVKNDTPLQLPEDKEVSESNSEAPLPKIPPTLQDNNKQEESLEPSLPDPQIEMVTDPAATPLEETLVEDSVDNNNEDNVKSPATSPLSDDVLDQLDALIEQSTQSNPDTEGASSSETTPELPLNNEELTIPSLEEFDEAIGITDTLLETAIEESNAQEQNIDEALPLDDDTNEEDAFPLPQEESSEPMNNNLLDSKLPPLPDVSADLEIAPQADEEVEDDTLLLPDFGEDDLTIPELNLEDLTIPGGDI